MDVGDVINGWRIVEDAGAGRSGHVFIVCREDDPDRLFALKMQRTDRPDVAPDANAREAALLRAGMKKSPRVMPELVEVGEWRGAPFFVMERIEEIDYPIPATRSGKKLFPRDHFPTASERRAGWLCGRGEYDTISTQT